MTTNNSSPLRVAVTGAGASGLMAAISAASAARERGVKVDVTVFEAGRFPGKKLLATGNGRCNLSNAAVGKENYYCDDALFESVYGRFNNDDAVSFFESIGVLTFTDDEGRIYPKSQRCDSVLNALIYECEKLGVNTVCDTKIISIEKRSGGFLLNGEFFAKCVVLAGGGLSAPGKGDVNALNEQLFGAGVKISPLRPSLTAAVVSGFPKSLKGVRAQGKVKLVHSKNTLAEETGEIQYTDYGLSGIAVMQLSAHIAASEKNDGFSLEVDSVPDMNFSEIKEHFDKIKKRSPEMPVMLFLSGIVPE
ncbi:MAG: aminoacetone oxidase family FAD-binding enzyme, partial [Clostridia bacterium]|nr:aminoacetone oxidase family FAD-binding enzyme [Clostridia bacterium]